MVLGDEKKSEIRLKSEDSVPCPDPLRYLDSDFWGFFLSRRGFSPFPILTSRKNCEIVIRSVTFSYSGLHLMFCIVYMVEYNFFTVLGSITTQSGFLFTIVFTHVM